MNPGSYERGVIEQAATVGACVPIFLAFPVMFLILVALTQLANHTGFRADSVPFAMERRAACYNGMRRILGEDCAAFHNCPFPPDFLA